MKKLLFNFFELPFRLYFYLRHHYFIPGIKHSDLVLEVGSGDNPKPRSDVLVEKFLDNDLERVSSVVVDRPLICGDILNLPFKDKSFDFVICSHLLEHIEDIEGALKELMRVGKRGYIETPSGLSERLQGYPFHRWYVDLEGQTIVFKEKKRSIHDSVLASDIHSAWKRYLSFRIYCYVNKEGLTCLNWNEKISYRVERVKEKSMTEDDKNFIHGDVDKQLDRGHQSLIKRLLKRVFRLFSWILRFGKNIDIESCLRCPICFDQINNFSNKKSDPVTCVQGHQFLVKNKIPVLLSKGPKNHNSILQRNFN